MEKAIALSAVHLAHIPEGNLSEMEDGKIPVNAEGSVAYTLKDSNGKSG